VHRRKSLLALLATAAIAASACTSTAAPSSGAATQAPSTAATPATSQAAPASVAAGTGAFQMDLPPGKGDVLVDTAKYAKPGPYRICFSNGFSGNSWRAMMLQSLKNFADAHKDLISELIIVDGQGDVNKQVSDIESCIAQKVDAIMLIANSGTAVAPVMKKALDAGIVVAPFNLMVESQDYTAYNGTDDCQRGTLAGKWLVDKLGSAGGGIIALGGIPGNSSTAAAWTCTQKEFEGTNVKVLAYKDANWQEDNAKVVCTDLLAAYPQIDGVWSDGGQDTTGCLKAFVAANRPLVPSTGDDYNGLFKLYLANKDANPKFDIYTLSQPTYESKLALQQVLAILTGSKEVYKTWLFAGGEITGANAAEKAKADLPDSVFVDNDLTDVQLKQIFAGQ
jgi:ribose transport system substrate-binding protein